jgi:LuxR family maltose regulon positive regulatory protein
MTNLASRQRGGHVPPPVARDVSGTAGLLDRTDLLRLLDRAVSKPLTVISAPPGSGKTSLLRAWAEHSTTMRRVAFVSVERDHSNEQRFWCAVRDAVRAPASPAPSAAPATATCGMRTNRP